MMLMIVENVKVGVGIIYCYFKNKESFVNELF